MKTPYRLYLETDFLKPDEVESAEADIAWAWEDANLPIARPIFNEVVAHAWHEAEAAWEAVKRADEIYGDSSLVPLGGYGSYTGSVVVFDVMMQKTIDENITGKSMFFLRPFADIHWDGIDLKLLKKGFKKNKLFTLERNEEGRSHFRQVNPTKDFKKL